MSDETRLHIHAPKPESVTIEMHACPTCKGDAPMLISTFEWYAPHSVCLRCGDHWHGSEMAPRPFARAWRAQSIDEAIRRAKAHGLSVPERMSEIDAHRR